MPRKLSELTATVIAQWLERESQTRPTQTALAFRLIRAFANWARGEDDYKGLIAADAFAARKVRDKVPKPGKRKDALQKEMLGPWFAAVRALPEPITSACLQTMLLIGCRPTEAKELRWQDVDFQWRSLTLRDKIAGERTIPLTPYVASILEPLPRINEWIFATVSKSGHIESPTKAHDRALVTAGLPHVTLQSLRRSFKSLTEWVEMPVGVVAQIMGHKPSATAEKHYTVRPLDLLRMWHTKLEAWILKQAGIEQPGSERPTDAAPSGQDTIGQEPATT
jgi:integrase